MLMVVMMTCDDHAGHIWDFQHTEFRNNNNNNNSNNNNNNNNNNHRQQQP